MLVWVPDPVCHTERGNSLIRFRLIISSQALTICSKQSCQLQLVNGNYKTDIASARTFGFEKDVDKLKLLSL